MSEEIKPKKKRKFLKALGKIGEVLIQELFFRVGSNLIRKIGGKKPLPSILFLFLSISLFAQFPNTLNKQRLGFQTTGDGLVWRGALSDTASIQPINNQSAWVILDTINLKFYTFDFTSNVWNLVGGAQGLTMPFDSITFNTAKDGTVGVGEVEYNDTQGGLIQGLKGGNVTNVIGQQLHQRVNNRTGAPLAKGEVVYLAGSQGNRITVAKGLAVSDAFSANTFGVVAENIADNASGFIITEGLITGLNTSALTEDSAVYLSPTVPGALTSTKPQAPQHSVYIGVCVKSNNGSGELFVKIRNGQELDELHDVRITSPVDKASLYYKLNEKLWRDTTAALLVSDTASMLANYSLKSYVDSIAQNFQDSIDEITNGYFKQEFPTVTKDTLNWTKPVQLPVGGSNLLLVYRNGQMINDAQYSVIDTNKVKINSGSYKLGENYTVVYVKGGGGSGSGGVPFDTSVLNLQARLDLKLNLSDTAVMLANYATKAYADTTGRFYARQDFSNVSSSSLTWTQSDTLVPGGVNVIQVYRNGQILLPSQYTVPTNATVVIAATSYKAGENYTVIFPRGGGAGSGGGSGSLTSISAGTGITVSPNPITTTGTVSADLSVLMELTDTSLLNLTSRFNAKQNTLVSGTNIKTVNSNSLLGSGNISVGTLVGDDTVSLSNRINTKLNSTDTAAMLSNYNTRINSKLNISDTLSMLAPYFRDADTSLLNLTSKFALKLNATDTASLSNRINAKGNGTVTSVATGYGITGGIITTTGTLVLDSAVVFSRIRDSIVDVAIGNDTIKILKQEYAPATTSVLTWTITSKFPIQSKAFILVFRNGQLLINDQYNLTDTNKITIVSNSFKSGANYTVVTVSGIGSVGTGVFPNPVYPEAGIAVSTGSAWASSIANNSSNWNVAFNDKINNAEFSGTNTKTLTLTQYDGGTFTPTFTDLQGVTGVTAGTGLTGGTITTTGTVAVDFTTVAPLANPTFTGTVSGITKSMVGLSNVDNTSDANKPVSTATQTALNGKENTITAGTTGQYFRGDKTFQTLDKSAVGLSNVDNTSDANKPVSTATQTALNGKQNTLTNPVTGTGTNNFIPKFTSTGSTIGNSTIQDNGTTVSTSSILSTTNYASFNTTQVMSNSSGILSTHRFTSANANGVYDKDFFLTSYTGAPWQGSDIGSGNRSKPPIVAIINNNDPSFINSGLHLMTTNSTNNTYTPAITFGVNSENGSYYNTIGAITAKKLNTGNYTSQSAGQLEFFGTGTALDATGASMTTANMTLGVGVGIGYTTAPTVRGRLTVLEKLGINQSTPNFALDVSGTANITGAATLGSTLAVTGAVTLSTTNTATPSSLLGKSTGNVVGNVRLTSPLALAGDSLNLGTVPISKGGTGADNASLARTLLSVGYNFVQVTAGSSVTITSNRVSVVNTGGFSTTQLDLTPATNGRMYMIKNLASGTVVSLHSNVIPLTGGSPTTAILSAGNATPQWVTLVADGTNWHVMQSN